MSHQPPQKRLKLDSGRNIFLKELVEYRDEIKKLNDFEAPAQIEIEESSIHSFVSNQIIESENRIGKRLDKIERKLNVLLDRLVEDWQEDDVEEEKEELLDGDDEIQEEEHIIEYVEDTEDVPGVDYELGNHMFPITDEEYFDWFMNRLKDSNYLAKLVDLRWELTKNCGTRSFHVAVKDFMLMHIDLAVVVKYSVSGYGSRGTKKKRLQGPAIMKFVFDCFNRLSPDVHSYQEVSKAVTQFWGRSPDAFTKIVERSVRREMNQKVKSELQ